MSRGRRSRAVRARRSASGASRRPAATRAAAAGALAVLLAVAQPAGATAPSSNNVPGASLPSGGQYFKLDPFIIPVMSRTDVVRHLTFIVTLELDSEGMRSRVLARLPILRNALNTALLQLVGVERSDDTLPSIAVVKSRMLDVTREVTGPDTVRAILMESVYERRLR